MTQRNASGSGSQCRGRPPRVLGVRGPDYITTLVFDLYWHIAFQISIDWSNQIISNYVYLIILISNILNYRKPTLFKDRFDI